MEFLDTFGYNEIVLKSDNETAIKVLRDDIINKRVRPTRPVGSVPMRPQTHGRAERAAQEVIDQVRKMKLVLERRLKAAIPVDLHIIHWMVEHAALLINRHLNGHDGKTAYRRKHQKEAPATQLEFGEQVLARFAPKRGKSKRRLPLAPRSTPAIWVGINEPTAENVVILQSGRAATVRTAFRKPAEDRWNLEQVLKVKAIPSNPNLANPGEEIIVLKPHDEAESKSGKDLPDTFSHNLIKKLRNFKLTKRIFEDYGYIEGCMGCEATQFGTTGRTHSTHCRQRILEELQKTEEGGKTLSDVEERLSKRKDELKEKTESDDDSTFEFEEEAEGVVAWTNNMIEEGCNAEQVRDILRKLDKSIEINGGKSPTVKRAVLASVNFTQFHELRHELPSMAYGQGFPRISLRMHLVESHGVSTGPR